MNLEQAIEELRPLMEQMHATREVTLQRSRKLIQTCSKAIRHMHRKQFEAADTLLAEARALSREARAGAAGFPEILYAGYIQDAEKEYVEAATVLAIIRGAAIPAMADLDVQPVSYLNGLGEAASEVRRYLLDELRAGRYSEAEEILGKMERIYDDLITFDFPDGMTGGLRRTCDALRAVIERTRSDLTLTHSQGELLRALRERMEESRG